MAARRFLATPFALFLVLMGSPVQAQPIQCEGVSDTLAGIDPAVFFPFRPGTQNIDRRWRDLEFLWDSMYPGGLSEDLTNTLDRYGVILSETPGLRWLR